MTKQNKVTGKIRPFAEEDIALGQWITWREPGAGYFTGVVVQIFKDSQIIAVQDCDTGKVTPILKCDAISYISIDKKLSKKEVLYELTVMMDRLDKSISENI